MTNLPVAGVPSLAAICESSPVAITSALPSRWRISRLLRSVQFSRSDGFVKSQEAILCRAVQVDVIGID